MVGGARLPPKPMRRTVGSTLFYRFVTIGQLVLVQKILLRYYYYELRNYEDVKYALYMIFMAYMF